MLTLILIFLIVCCILGWAIQSTAKGSKELIANGQAWRVWLGCGMLLCIPVMLYFGSV